MEWDIYFGKEIDCAKDYDKGMDSIFPISFSEIGRAPERSPVEEPNNISH